MADPSIPTPPQSEDQSQSSTQPKCRRATRLKDLIFSRNVDQKLPIQFDMSTGKVIGNNRARFTSFVALLGRSKVSILIDKWDHVPEEVKNKIWQTIMEKRKVAQDLQKKNLHPHRLSRGGYDRLEEIMIREASSLATGDQSDLISPPPRHEKWKRARTKPSGEYTSEETRLVAEKIESPRVLCPPFFCCWTILKSKLLEPKWINVCSLFLCAHPLLDVAGSYCLFLLDPAAPDLLDRFKITIAHPFPVDRCSLHVSGPAAGIVLMGRDVLLHILIFCPCRVSAAIKLLDHFRSHFLERVYVPFFTKLDALGREVVLPWAKKRSKGSFTQEARDDILAVAIGRPEHPGYICGVGQGVGLEQFFGGPTRKVLRNEFKKEMFPELRDELLAEIKSEIASLGLVIQVPPKGASHVASIKGSCPLPEESGDGADGSCPLPKESGDGADIASLGLAIQVPPKGASHVVSTKGSCPLPKESGDGADVPIDCELYVDDPHLHLVALDIKDSSARVPLPSEEVQTVGQAPGNFIIWPARLAKPILDISKKTNIVTPPQPQLSPLQQLGASVVTMGNKTIELDMPPELTCKIATTTLFICRRDICEIVTGNDLLSTTTFEGTFSAETIIGGAATFFLHFFSGTMFQLLDFG
ncbi:hypothetical protein V8G54_004368 [Vigna mungo]|uniref:Uncharacterized protein n=1 Tax=Vigna mungo TaxID=3915 RepID=A0AAQ3SB18_VIGMU